MFAAIICELRSAIYFIRVLIHKTYLFVSLIIAGVIYVSGGCNSNGEFLNTLPSFGMTSQEWATMQPVSEKRGNHIVRLQGDRIVVAGGRNRSKYRDTCGTQSREGLFDPTLVVLSTIVQAILIQLQSACS